jgi:hypothetical protein
VTSFPFFDSGSLDFASVAGGSIGYGNNCDYNVRPTTKSVWYLVEGDGSCYTASATGSGSGSAFDTVVAIYDGQSCDRLSCSAQSEYGNKISWETRNGETYYILVGGLYENSGVFSLSIEVCDLNHNPPAVFFRRLLLILFFLSVFLSGLILARSMPVEFSVL